MAAEPADSGGPSSLKTALGAAGRLARDAVSTGKSECWSEPPKNALVGACCAAKCCGCESKRMVVARRAAGRNLRNEDFAMVTLVQPSIGLTDLYFRIRPQPRKGSQSALTDGYQSHRQEVCERSS